MKKRAKNAPNMKYQLFNRVAIASKGIGCKILRHLSRAIERGAPPISQRYIKNRMRLILG
jgi:hypothetical protein